MRTSEVCGRTFSTVAVPTFDDRPSAAQRLPEDRQRWPARTPVAAAIDQHQHARIAALPPLVGQHDVPGGRSPAGRPRGLGRQRGLRERLEVVALEHARRRRASPGDRHIVVRLDDATQPAVWMLVSSRRGRHRRELSCTRRRTKYSWPGCSPCLVPALMTTRRRGRT